MPRRLPHGLLFLLLLALPSLAHAQSDATEDAPSLRDLPLSLGTLIQVDGTAGRENASDGFNIETARLRVKGEAYGASVKLQVDLRRSPALLDAAIRLPVTSRLAIWAGREKAPFSREELISSSALPFLERSRVVDVLAPSRQVGVSAELDLVPGALRVMGGIFNGNSNSLVLNDGDGLMYVGRLTGSVPFEDGALDLGVNAGYSDDDAAAFAPYSPSFDGTRTLFGVDAAASWQGWQLAGEWITASIDPAATPRDYEPSGYYLTLRYQFADRHQLLARLDDFNDDRAGTPLDEQILLGYNFAWTRTLRVQANYVAPSEQLEEGAVSVRLQFFID